MKQLKHFSVLLFFFTLVANLQAQETVQIDFFKAISLNADELKLYISKLGLTDFKESRDESGYDYSWTIERQIIDPSQSKSSFHIYHQFDRTRVLSFHTDYRDDYLKFKKSIEFNGLKLCKQKNYNDFLIEIYANKLYESTIYAKPDNHIMHYEISLKMFKLKN